MFWAMGALLFQLHAVPQVTVAAASKAAVQTVQAPAVAPVAENEKLMVADASASDEAVALEPGRLALTPVAASPAASPAPAASPIAPVIAAPRRAPYAGRITGGPQKQWLALAIAGHSAATFDAWSTRRAITRSGAQELNPMLKPFAGNRSIYAATQIGPTLLDVLGRKMMTSRHPLLQHTWWLPQVLGTAASLAGGMHNLGVR
jgi:hypothetical protein